MEQDAKRDQALFERVRQGDQEALRVLYRLHGGFVYGYALRIVRDRNVAEEITQDVFLKVWEKAAAFDPAKASPLTWMVRIGRNRAIDVMRSPRWRQRHAERGLADSLPAADARPDEQYFIALEQDRLRATMSGLSPTQQTALNMAFFQGLSYRQIARVLGEPEGTIKSRIRDAMSRLRSDLAEGRELYE